MVDRTLDELHSLQRRVDQAERSEQAAVTEARAAREQIVQLQRLLGEQADELQRCRDRTERVTALADFADWANQSAGTGEPARVLVDDLRRANQAGADPISEAG